MHGQSIYRRAKDDKSESAINDRMGCFWCVFIVVLVWATLIYYIQESEEKKKLGKPEVHQVPKHRQQF